MKVFQTRTQPTRDLMPPLRKENLTTQGWACLSGRLIKAANTRALVPWLLHLARTHFARQTALSVAIRNVFESLNSIERIMYTAGTFLDEAELAEFRECFLVLGES